MTSRSFWDEKPRRALEWRETDDGRCVLLRPKFGKGLLGRWLATRIRDPHYRIRLDEVGTFVWKASDGQTPFSIIVAGLRMRFGARVEPAEQRLAVFARQMLRSRTIEIGEALGGQGSEWKGAIPAGTDL
jgi:hypothetical protein